jgi:BASS family bile acid:Na+ symporter
MSFLCKGDVAFSVGMTTVSTLAAPVLTPLLMLWLAGESVDVDAVGMFVSILIVTILPIAIGFAANAAMDGNLRFAEFKKTLPGVAVLGLACIVGGVMWSPIYAEQPLWYSILITILALLAIFKHRQNIVRLCKGTENRFAFTAKQRAARDAKRAQQETSK